VYGPGGNGRSTFLSAVRGILDVYVAVAPMTTFVASKTDRHPTELAMLKGARFVMASETEKGRPWAEALIKQLTGRDPVTARFMNRNFFTYDPEFKLTIVGQCKPALRDVDDATRRRFIIVPFLQKPLIRDLVLRQKLKASMAGYSNG
jgi:putative DNA primase/helicase